MHNGQVYFGPHFPNEGLDDLDTWMGAELNRRVWGIYSFSKGKGKVRLPYAELPINMEGNQLLITSNKTDHGFIKLPSVDGVKFQGQYFMSSEDILGNEAGKRPSITLRINGRFVDDGAISLLYHEYISCLDPALRPGSGTYMVRNHSVIFSYDDGRNIKIAFPVYGFDETSESPATLRLSANDDVLTRQ